MGTFDLKPVDLSFIRILIDLNSQNSSRSKGQGHRSMSVLRGLRLLQKLRDIQDMTGVCRFSIILTFVLDFFDMQKKKLSMLLQVVLCLYDYSFSLM